MRRRDILKGVLVSPFLSRKSQAEKVPWKVCAKKYNFWIGEPYHWGDGVWADIYPKWTQDHMGWRIAIAINGKKIGLDAQFKNASSQIKAEK